MTFQNLQTLGRTHNICGQTMFVFRSLYYETILFSILCGFFSVFDNACAFPDIFFLSFHFGIISLVLVLFRNLIIPKNEDFCNLQSSSFFSFWGCYFATAPFIVLLVQKDQNVGSCDSPHAPHRPRRGE